MSECQLKLILPTAVPMVANAGFATFEVSLGYSCNTAMMRNGWCLTIQADGFLVGRHFQTFELASNKMSVIRHIVEEMIKSLKEIKDAKN